MMWMWLMLRGIWDIPSRRRKGRLHIVLLVNALILQNYPIRIGEELQGKKKFT
jgi:hypothetical protein